MKDKKDILIGFTKEELEILTDGMEDTQTLMRERIAKPVSVRYIFLVKNIKSKIEDRLENHHYGKKRLEKKLKEETN